MPEVEHVVVCLAGRAELSSEFEALGVRIHHMEMASSANPVAAARRLRRIVEDERPHVVHGWLYHANFLLSLALLRGRDLPPIAWGIRSAYEGFNPKAAKTSLLVLFSRLLTRIPAVITFNSHRSMEQHEAIGYPASKFRYLPNGFDPERFKRRAEAREALRAEFGFAADDVVIMIVGRYDFTKDFPTFVRALALANAKNPKIRALMVGRGVDSSPELTNLLQQLSLERVVKRLGYSERTELLYSAGDVACSSSVSEGFPNVVAEALFSELPAVVTDVGMSAVLVGGEGSVVSAGDTEALAEGFLRLAALPEGERRAIGARARERMCSDYGLERAVRLHLDLYKELCKGASKGRVTDAR